MKRILVSTFLALALATPAAAAGSHAGMGGGHSGASHFGGSIIRVPSSGMVAGPRASGDHVVHPIHRVHGRAFWNGGNDGDASYQVQPAWRCRWQHSPGGWQKFCGRP